MVKKKLSPIKSYKLKNGETRYEFPVYLGVDFTNRYTETYFEAGL